MTTENSTIREWNWVSIDGPVTKGWWALERGGERLALLQPFDGKVALVFYLSEQPWHQHRGMAGATRQAKRYAERWLAPRIAGREPRFATVMV